MPTTYVLKSDPDTNIYTMIVHTATPAGNNSAGVAWSTCLANSGLNTTAMSVGTGPGQLSSADAAAIAAGTMMEGSFVFCDDPSMTNPQRLAAITTQANACITNLQNRLAAVLKWYGQTITTS